MGFKDASHLPPVKTEGNGYLFSWKDNYWKSSHSLIPLLNPSCKDDLFIERQGHQTDTSRDRILPSTVNVVEGCHWKITEKNPPDNVDKNQRVLPSDFDTPAFIKSPPMGLMMDLNFPPVKTGGNGYHLCFIPTSRLYEMFSLSWIFNNPCLHQHAIVFLANILS